MKIRLHPIGVEIEGDSNRSLLQLCHDNKVELKSLCKGVPSCAECRIKILAGDANVIPPNKAELSLIGTSYYIDGRRLACQIRCFGDISVDITDHLKEDDNTTKKLRGYRAPPGQSRESKAVQGTMVLQEPAAPLENTGGGRRGGKPANERTARGSNDRGRQVRHPGDELVAGSEHPETQETADLDGSGDEGLIDGSHIGGDIFAGDEADTSEAITKRLESQTDTDDDDDDEDDAGEDSQESEVLAPAQRSGGSRPQNRQGQSRPQGGGGNRGPGGGQGQNAQASGGEGGGQKRRRRRGGRGRRGGGSGGGPGAGGGGGGRGPGGGSGG